MNLPQPISMTVEVREVTIGEVQEDQLSLEQDAILKVPYELSRKMDATHSRCSASVDLRIGGTVDVSRSDLATVSGKRYADLTASEKATYLATILAQELTVMLTGIERALEIP